MGRPKGSNSKPLLDEGNIIPEKKRVTDENANVLESIPPPPKKADNPVMSTRKKFLDCQIWNNLVGSPPEILPQTKLPKNKVILQRYLSLRSQYPTDKVSSLVSILYTEVTDIWRLARIHTLEEKKCKRIIKNLIQKYNNFKHYKPKKTLPKRVTDIKEILNQLCDLAPANLKTLLQSTYRLNKKWEDDWQFYLNMSEVNQVGCMSSKDVKLAGKEGVKQSKQENKKTRKTKAQSYKENISKAVTGSEFDDGTVQNVDSEKDKDIVIKQKKAKGKGKLLLQIDPKKIVEQTTGTSDRLGISSRQTAMLLSCVVKAGGGDLTKVPVSKSNIHRERNKHRIKKGKEIKDSFVHSKDGFILHYDTKLVNPKGRDTEDRAAVLYSGGEHKQPYLLGIPKFTSSAGKDVQEGVVKELDKYSIKLENCLGTCYDTTASNSGYKSGAHFRLEKQINHAILELECRKHVHELHVTHANKAVFGPTKGPQKSHYKKLKEAWSSMKLDTSSMKVFDWMEYSDQTFLTERAKQSLDWAEWHLQQGTFPRDDYKEINELIVVYLGGVIPGGFKPKRKGAMHEARFMADAIYLLSMELFSDEFLNDNRLVDQVHKMAVFIAIWHAPSFLKCSLAASAPANDLAYFYDMVELSEMEDKDYSKIGTQVADSIQRHTCYLKAPQVIFGLFDEKSKPKDRQYLASALFKIPRPETSPSYFKPGKMADVPLVCSTQECVGSPTCMNEDGLLYPKKTLANLVSVKSYLLFNLLGIEDMSWLAVPVALWSCCPSYVKARDFVRQLLVVNDGAERGKNI